MTFKDKQVVFWPLLLLGVGVSLLFVIDAWIVT